MVTAKTNVTTLMEVIRVVADQVLLSAKINIRAWVGWPFKCFVMFS